MQWRFLVFTLFITLNCSSNKNIKKTLQYEHFWKEYQVNFTTSSEEKKLATSIIQTYPATFYSGITGANHWKFPKGKRIEYINVLENEFTDKHNEEIFTKKLKPQGFLIKVQNKSRNSQIIDISKSNILECNKNSLSINTDQAEYRYFSTKPKNIFIPSKGKKSFFIFPVKKLKYSRYSGASFKTLDCISNTLLLNINNKQIKIQQNVEVKNIKPIRIIKTIINTTDKSLSNPQNITKEKQIIIKRF